jgi:chromosome segregation ATPase
MVKLIQLLLVIAVQSPKKTDILNRIKKLSHSSQNVLKTMVQNLPTSVDSDPQIQLIEREISMAKKQISDLEADLQRTESGEEGHGESERECEDLRERLAKAKAAQERVRSEYTSAKRKYDDKVQRLRRHESESAAKKELQAAIELIDSSLFEHKKLESEVTEWRQKTKAYEVEIGSVEEEIRALKDEITTSVQLAEKYGAAGLEEIAPAENEAKETVPELANRISQLEVEIAVLKDSLESGQTGIPPELAKEHDDLRKVISRLLKRKKALEGEAVKKKQLREELQRVQKLMVDQREEVERELEKLTDEVNIRNIELTNWLSFSSSFEALGQSATFISELRQKYL